MGPKPRTRSTAVAALTVAAIAAALFPPPASAAPPLVSPTGAGTVVIGPQAMEGNLQIHPGDPLRAGFDFTMPGSHAAAIAYFSSGYVSLLVKCANGSTPPLTIQLQPQSISDPAGSSSWYPSGDQSSSLVYQGALTAPDLCSGGVMNDASGAQFTTSFFSTDTLDKVNFRFHYSDSTSGSWSATVTGTPTPFAKTVTTASLTPALGMVLSSDHATAIPGDTITYSATVTNSGSTLAVGGDFLASATGSSAGTVKSYWDDVSTSLDGSTWTVLGGTAAAASGYTPALSPPTTSGMSLTAKSVAASGVAYPSSGDPMLGTTISSGSTAQWHYTASLNLSAAQAASLLDPTKVKRLRNTFHLEVSPANPNVSQTAVINLDFTNLFYGGGASASLTNVKVTIQPPGSAAPLQFNSTTNPALGTLASGGSASVQGTFVVPAAPAKASGESDSAYFAALSALEASILQATGSATATAATGTVNASSPAPATTTEHLPIVSITKSGPASVTPGSTETNPLTLTNSGGATASTLVVSDSVFGGGSGTVTGVPATLAPGTSATATAAFPVPPGQSPGPLTDVASLTWQDGNAGAYGPVSSSFTTAVTNPFAGATLTLVPATAGPNAPGITQTLTATLLDAAKQPIANQPVSFVISGANQKSGTAVTDADGNATFSYVGFDEGTDTATATFTAPGTTLTSNQATITWVQSLQTVAVGTVQGNFYNNPSDICHFGADATTTPVFSQSFPNIMFNPDPAIFKFQPPFLRPDVNGTIPNNFIRPFTDVTTDVNGNPNGTIIASDNGFAAGVDPQDFFASFTGSFLVIQPGDVTFRILHSDGYLLGVASPATRVSGDFDGDVVPTTTPIKGYPTVAAFNTSSSGSSSSGTATVHFPAAGTYPFELDYTDCGGPLFLDLLTQSFVAQTSPLSVYVGYADGLRPAGSIFPFPWAQSPGVASFYGCPQPCQFDGGTIRLDNSGSSALQVDSVTVDIPFAPGVGDCPGVTHFDIWPHNITVPAGQIVILAPNAPGTTCSGDQPFDTSDTSFYCGPNTGVIPVVNITSGGVTTSFNDTKQVLNTGGRDQADCGGNESESWQRIGGGGTAINVPLPPAAQLSLTPFNVPDGVQGQSITETVAALDGAGNPVPNLAVKLGVFGPNAQSQTASTGTDGTVSFTYAGNLPGTDTVQATAFINGLQAVSNNATVIWTPTGGTNNPLAPTITSPTPADGAIITKPTPVDATIAPPSGHTVTSWRVFYQAAAGGPQVVIGSGTGTPPSPLGVTFDPTLLADGAYRLVTEATADDGAVQDVVSGVSVYGALKLGRYQTQFLDLAVPVSGYDMQVLRTYDSTDLSNGDFGIGWRVSVSNFRVADNHTLGAGGWTQYNKSCVLGLCFTAFRDTAPRFVDVVYPDGHSEIFDFVPDGGTNLFWSCTPMFKARSSIGSTSTLIPLDDTACSYTGDGNLYGSSGPYNPQRFQLTTRTGQVLVLDTKVGLVSMTDRNGNKLSVDASGVHSSTGASITFARDGSGRITTITGPSNQTLSYTYSASGDLASSTDPNGNVDTYAYDSNHRLLSVSGPQGSIASQAYDTSGRLVSLTDANHHTTQIQNDVAGQTMTLTDALGTTVTVLTSDDLGDVVRSDVTSGGVTETSLFAFDAVGHPVQKTDPAGHTIKATYDSLGDLATYVDALGNTTKFSYDSFGNVTSILAPDGSLVGSFVYDSSGNATTIVESGGVTLHLTYDAAGNITSRADASGVTSSTYDASGRVTQVTDATGKSLNMSYDSSNRLLSATDALGNITRRTYDADGNVVGITDARGISETLTYGPNGQVTSVTDPLGTATATYDADSRMTSATDTAGNATTYTYDADGRTTRVDYSDGDFLAYTFDGFGRPVTISNSVSSISDTYDHAGNLVSSTTHGSTFGAVTLSYTYDAAGNRLSSTGPDGTVNYAYNSIDQLVKVTDPSGGSFGLQYDSASQLTTLTRPNGVTDNYTYDANGKLVGIASSLGGTTVQSLTQTLDANGLTSSRTDGSGTATFTHDANGRLVGVSGPGSVSQAYTYDAAGNRTSDPQSAASAYDSANQLTSDSNFTYTYDAAGRLIAKTARSSGATTHYAWNGRGQLSSIKYPDGTTTDYTYDPLGRRLSVTSGGATTAYVYDGQDVRLEYGGASIAASYVDGDAADHPLEMVRGGASYYYMQDFQGSVTGVTDSAGSVKAAYSYDAFGIPTGSVSGVANPFTYTGREYDAKSGLYYNRARYYDPTTGGFISQDPIATGQPYAYAAGDPVDFTDQGGALWAEQIEQYIETEQRIPGQRLIGCAVSYIGSLVEFGFNMAEHSPKTSEAIAAVIGLVTGCLLSALGAYAGEVWQLLLIPAVAAVLAGIVDVLTSWACTGTFDFNHAIAVGVGVLAIGAVGALFGKQVGPIKTVAQVLFSTVGGVSTGILAGGLDQTLGAGGNSC